MISPRSPSGRWIFTPMKTRLTLVLALTAMSLLTGCVTGRRTLALNLPAAGAPGTGHGDVFVGAITDNRVFMNQPNDPSIPSIDGDVKTMSAEQKAIMIGRQRNTYGHAMGDIGLAPGESVSKQCRLLLEQGLKKRGFTISANSAAANSVSAVINQFWAWGTPGFWALSFDAQIECILTLKKDADSSKVTVRGKGHASGQVASDENWQQAYLAAFQDFLTNLDIELAKAGF